MSLHLLKYLLNFHTICINSKSISRWEKSYFTMVKNRSLNIICNKIDPVDKKWDPK